MALNKNVRNTLIFFSMLSLALSGCQESATRPPPDQTILIIPDGGTPGCSQPFFPEDQPDLQVSRRPIFLLTNTNSQQSTSGQATARPGDTVEAEVSVNGATRQALIELKDAWVDIPAIGTVELETTGNETLDVFFPTDASQRPSRYYMKITLCGLDCDEQEVVYDIIPYDPDVDAAVVRTGHNAPYQRTLIQDGEVVQIDDTCIELNARQGIGSGTVLIQ